MSSARKRRAPGQCPYCDYSTSSDNLSRHVKLIHKDAPPAVKPQPSGDRVTCPDCQPPEYRSKSNLARHRRTVHKATKELVVDKLRRDGHPPNKDTPPPTLPQTLPRQSLFDTGLEISIDPAILNANEDSLEDFQSTLGETEKRGGVSISLEEEVAEYEVRAHQALEEH